MRNFQEKNKFKKFMQSKPVLVILALLVFLFAWNIVNLSIKLKETYKNKNIEQQFHLHILTDWEEPIKIICFRT